MKCDRKKSNVFNWHEKKTCTKKLPPPPQKFNGPSLMTIPAEKSIIRNKPPLRALHAGIAHTPPLSFTHRYRRSRLLTHSIITIA